MLKDNIWEFPGEYDIGVNLRIVVYSLLSILGADSYIAV